MEGGFRRKYLHLHFSWVAVVWLIHPGLHRLVRATAPPSKAHIHHHTLLLPGSSVIPDLPAGARPRHPYSIWFGLVDVAGALARRPKGSRMQDALLCYEWGTTYSLYHYFQDTCTCHSQPVQKPQSSVLLPPRLCIRHCLNREPGIISHSPDGTYTCQPSWPRTHRSPPGSASPVLG